jgi:Family of unknown function (DUF6325)
VTIGPVQLLVVGLHDPHAEAAILGELERLREGDVVRLVDLLVVRKDAGGNVEPVRRDDAAQHGATVAALIGLGVGGAEGAGHAVGEDDVWCVDDAIPSDSTAAIALVEHCWAIGLRDAIRDAGGSHLADAWVHPADLVAVGLMAAEEAAAR